MDPRDARLVTSEARKWAARGLLTPEAFAEIEREYAFDPKQAEGPGVGLSILYALAGVMLGAACIAVPTLLHSHDVQAPWQLLGLGLPLLGFGILLWRKGAPAGMVDAVLIGSLVPLSFMGLPDDRLGRWLAPLSLLAAIAVAWLPRASTTVPVLGNVAIFASAGVVSHRLFGSWFDNRSSAWLWLALGLVQLGATLVWAKRAAWRTTTTALLCIGLVIPFVLALDRALPSHNLRFYELMVGAFEFAVLFVGLAIRERGLVLGAAIVIAIDAIVYSFERNVLLGIGVLLGVAVLLITLAGTLKRYVRQPA